MNPLPFSLRDPALPPWLRPEAAYVHIPFCRHHCGYCDFAVAVGRDERMADYLDALEAELARLENPYPVATLFLGGGTPSHLDEKNLERLLRLLDRWLPRLPDHEFSLEANPESLTAEKVHLLATHGVNRLSLGAQSFRPEILEALERPHDPGDVFRAVDLAREHFRAISLDLIFGVPGQDLPGWERDLREGMALGVAHIATYGLTYEKGTPLWKRRAAGLSTPLEEDAERAMYETAMDLLEGTGLRHYEISNFARPGAESRHNRTYWANHAYLGFGMGAASYMGGARRLTVRSLDGYLDRALSGRPTWFQEERLTGAEKALETAALQLRRGEGIHRATFRNQTGIELDVLVGSAVESLAENGLLTNEGHRVFLTRSGKCVADAIIGELYRQAGKRREAGET